MTAKQLWKRLKNGLLHRLHLRRKRVPVVLQLSSTECGAACLAMILGYHGQKMSMSQCRTHFSAGRDGISVGSIVKAARACKLKVKAYSTELHSFAEIPLPAIIYWNFNHFVVVERRLKKGAVIIDPASGRRVVDFQEFRRSFTGVVITFAPGPDFQPRRARNQANRAYIQQVLKIPHVPGLLGQVILASLLLSLLGLVTPLLTQIIVDRVIPQHITDVLFILGLSIIVVVIAQFICGYIRTLTLQYLQTQVDAQMTRAFFQHMLSLPFDFFLRRAHGDLLMRLESSTIIRDILTNQTLSILLDGSLVIIYLCILLLNAPLLGALILLITILQFATLFFTSSAMHEATQRHLIAQSRSQSFSVQLLKGVATIKAVGAEEHVFNHWTELFFRELQASFRRSKTSAVIGLQLNTLRTLAMLILLWLGAWLVLSGNMSLGEMLAYNALAVSFLIPLSSLAGTSQELQLISAHFERMRDVLDAEPEKQTAASVQVADLTTRIELDAVSFRYDAQSPLVLKDISLTIQPGSKVALVGRSGSGKSSLAMLLLGMYPATQGQVIYGGHPLSELNYQEMRHRYGVVLQDPFLFNGTILENIALHNPDLTLEESVQAARLAHIHDEIVSMPMGYETLLGEDGGGLSGGQRQRIALARALAQQPAILLLDEATSHLDATTEAIVDHNLSQLNCTRIVIAHRLSTVLNADMIIVLDQGGIVGRGIHTELLSSNQIYAELVRNQLRQEIYEPDAT